MVRFTTSNLDSPTNAASLGNTVTFHCLSNVDYLCHSLSQQSLYNKMNHACPSLSAHPGLCPCLQGFSTHPWVLSLCSNGPVGWSNTQDGMIPAASSNTDPLLWAVSAYRPRDEWKTGEYDWLLTSIRGTTGNFEYSSNQEGWGFK